MKTQPRNHAARTIVILALALGLEAAPALAQSEGKNIQSYSVNPADAAACKVQLDLIYEAVEQHRELTAQWPSWLSDLVPDSLADRRLLHCPYVSKTLDLDSWRKQYFSEVFRDPYSSYGYEFCLEPYPFHIWRGVRKTQRDYKLAQVVFLGPERGQLVPLVRCFAHRPVLNLAVNGEVYESGGYWEEVVAPELHDEMEPGILLNGTLPPLERPIIPPRDSNVGPLQVDLSDFYNGALTNDWQGFPGNNLAGLPVGGHELNGVRYDLRGVVQLSGGIRLPRKFPKQVEGIPIGRRCKGIHFLHATGRTPQMDEITNVVTYVVTYADGKRVSHEVEYYRDILDWWQEPSLNEAAGLVKVAWQGDNEAAKSYGQVIQLYDCFWENPRQDIAISHIDFIGTALTGAPFLVAVTLE